MGKLKDEEIPRKGGDKSKDIKDRNEKVSERVLLSEMAQIVYS
jgi:hypothetical protein